MTSNYSLEIEDAIDLNGTPRALETLSLGTSERYVLCALADRNCIAFIKSGDTSKFQEVPVGAGPSDITRGARSFAYIACSEGQTVDVIDHKMRVARIEMPGRPHGVAWNGSYRRGKSRILVTCQLDDKKSGVICVIDEETLEIIKVLPIGNHPRGICLDDHSKLFFIANRADDSITIIDQSGTNIVHKIATAGRPSAPVYSWAEPEHVIVCLQAGGVLQRLDTSKNPPELSGLTALRLPYPLKTNLTPTDCAPLGQDHLWLATDQHSESIALVRSKAREFNQIDCFELDGSNSSHTGLGQITVITPGLPARFYIANIKRRQLMLARLVKTKTAPRARAIVSIREKL